MLWLPKLRTLTYVARLCGKDTGRYRIRVENENGFDEETVELVVLGPPSRPMGPLICTDITAHSCKLHWEPPEDDGGMPIQEYEVEMLNPRTKRWIKVGWLAYISPERIWSD